MRECTRKEGSSSPLLSVGKPYVDVDNKESPGEQNVFIDLICEHTHSQYGSDFNSSQFEQVDTERFIWVLISQEDPDKCQVWFPDEGGKEWFVGPKATKKKSGKTHPTGELCVHVIDMHLTLLTCRVHDLVFS